MVALPESRPEDDEDVVWGLSTASALWARGERRDAIVWLRRAADAASTAGQEFRGSELGMYAGELEEVLNAADAAVDSALPSEPSLPPRAAVAAQVAPAPVAQAAPTQGAPEVIELLDLEPEEQASPPSIELEEEAPSLPPTRIALAPAAVPSRSIAPPAPSRSAPPAARSIAPPAPSRSIAPPPVAPAPPSAVRAPSSPPKAISAAPPAAAAAPVVEIPPPSSPGVSALLPPSFEVTPLPASTSMRAGPRSSKRLSPESPRKSQPRAPILDPWADEPADGHVSAPRPAVSFRQSEEGGDELVLPRRPQGSQRSGDTDDEVVTSAAPLDASLTKKLQPPPPRKAAPKQPSPSADPGPAPGQLVQAAAIVPAKGLSVPPPPAVGASKGLSMPPPPAVGASKGLSVPPPAAIASKGLSVPPPAAIVPSKGLSMPPPPAVSPSVPAPKASPPLAPPSKTAVAPRLSVAPPPPVAAAPRPATPSSAPAAPKPPVVAATPKPSAAPPPVAKAEPPPPAAKAEPPPPSAKPEPPPPSAKLEPPPVVKSVRPPASALIDGVPLDEVDAFVDLPLDMQHRLVTLARIEALSADEEVSSFGAALLLAGEAAVCANIVDTPACRAVKGTLVPSRGSLAEAVGIRVVAGSQGARVAIWDQPVIEDALRSCPWVLDELVSRADRIQALAGATMGPLGEMDEGPRNELLDRLTVHFAQPQESLVEAGGVTLGIAIIGGGVVELAAHGAKAAQGLHPGELLFARAVLEGLPAPRSAQAGAAGALVLIGEAKLAKELMASSPPLAALLADASE